MTPELDKIYTGDCLKIMREWPEACIDLTVTSPPYDNLRTYNGYVFDFEAIANQLYRVTKKGGVVVWVVGDSTINGTESGTSFKQALYFKEIGFNLHDTMIYGKLNFIPLTHNRYEQEFEFMFVLSKGGPRSFHPLTEKARGWGDVHHLARKGYGFKEGAFRRRNESITIGETKRRGNVWYYACGNSGNNHQAPFPESLARDHIVSWSNDGDTVLDPMCGSGTTCKMAVRNKRHFIGIDISEEYCELSRRCIDAEMRQGKLL